MLTGCTVSALRRIPPSMQDAVLTRGEWTLCAMEHSAMGAVHINDPGAPFHHIGLMLGYEPVQVGMDGYGRPIGATLGRGDMAVIEAGVGGSSWWNGTYESACFYFTTQSLAIALGCDIEERQHAIRSTLTFDAPVVRRLLHTLHTDAEMGQPHGSLVGDAVFVALSAHLVSPDGEWRGRARPGTPDWRVRRALEYIHARLTDTLTIPAIAQAAGTSPFHLSRQFRTALGLPIWRYVLRERARAALKLMQTPALSLTDVSRAVGFETYASFIETSRREFGDLPSRLRSTQRGSAH